MCSAQKPRAASSTDRGYDRCQAIPSAMTLWRSGWPLAILLFFMIGLFSLSAFAEEEKTPEAGKEFRTTLFGEEIYVPPRDRRSVTAIELRYELDSKWAE